MKLVQPTFELTLGCVRRYSERAVIEPQRTIRTIPYTVWRAPLAPRLRLKHFAPRIQAQPVAIAHRKNVDRETFADWMKQYRLHIGQSEFTTSDLAEFLLGLGWQVRSPLTSAAQKLRQLYLNGEVEQSRQLKRTIYWRFAQ